MEDSSVHHLKMNGAAERPQVTLGEHQSSTAQEEEDIQRRAIKLEN